MDKSRIIEYYDYTLPFYRFFWHKETNAMHHGFWEKETKNLRQALLNTNKFLAQMTEIDKDAKVLDAGCGIGGSAVWLAKNLGAYVIGITLSAKQKEKAIEIARKEKVEHLTEFYAEDFLRSHFPDRSFDVVWAVESACHAENKKDFLKEAYRLLKNKGKLVVADGFLKREVYEQEREIYQDFLAGLVLSNLSSFADFQEAMGEVGFKNVKFWDKTDGVKKSCQLLYRKCLFWYPVFNLLRLLHLVSDLLIKNIKTGIAEYKIVKRGLAGYGVFYGEKL